MDCRNVDAGGGEICDCLHCIEADRRPGCICKIAEVKSRAVARAAA